MSAIDAAKRVFRIEAQSILDLAERIDFFRRFYDTGWLSPWSYDLCLNTDHLSSKQAAEVIVHFASSR